MASSPSSSKNYDDADRPNDIQPFLHDLSNLHQQLCTIDPSHVGDREHLKLLSEELKYIQSAFKKLDPSGSRVGDRLSKLKDCISDIVEHALSAPDSGPISAGQKIHALACSIANLKALLLWVSRDTTTNTSTEKTGNWIPVYNVLLEEISGDGYRSVFEGLVEDLDERARELLLHFAAFPLEKIINKRVLKNWWIADVLSQLPADKAEEKADRVLEELEQRRLIEAVRKRRRLVGFKIPHPWVHFALVRYAKEKKFFAFDSKWNPITQPMTSLRGCLANTSDERKLILKRKQAKEESEHQFAPQTGPLQDPTERSIVDQKLSKKEQDVRLENKEAGLDKLQILFNISDQYPHLRDEFSRAKDIRVLSLGKWQSSEDFHIEVESTEFLKAPKRFKHLRFFSLRGVSRVLKLPDDLCKLSSLTILDLKACYNLEELPDGIGSLKRLIYLDISDCYLLENLPKGLASLTELRVLKGFVIINTTSSCSFKDLAELNKLKKLGITAYRSYFPTEDDLKTFKKFPLLEKLTISWESKDTSRKQDGAANVAEKEIEPRVIERTGKRTVQSSEAATQPEEVFPSLEKLNLQCYPMEEAPHWLQPHNMKNLKRLYIVGGQLHNLKKGQSDRAWSVEILRLKYLKKMETSREDLQALFPKLIYLEKVQHDDHDDHDASVNDQENVQCVKFTTFGRDWEADWVKNEGTGNCNEEWFFEKEKGLP